jgi:hypothetical protein
MTEPVRDVFFFIRAYNDLDIQLSLISAFASDSRFRVEVFFYPSDGFITHPHVHEATNYMKRIYGIQFRSVLELPGCPLWLRALYLLKKWAYGIRVHSCYGRILPLALIARGIDAGLGKALRTALSQDNPAWLHRISRSWNPYLVFTDEILFQPDRSPLIDHIIPALVERGSHLYAILTGHRVYKAVYPTGADKPQPYRPSKAHRYFVPSEKNKAIYAQMFPKETITVSGNLRMDTGWVDTLHRDVLPAPASLPRRKVNVVLMLSKLDYGVNVDQLKDTIRRLGAMDDVALAIKPHTRAMKFNFMTREEIGHAHVVDHIPSTTLIGWGDVILMTGSSIVFHAMVKGKIAGFLRYCQNLETIFDDGQGCLGFESLDSLQSYLQELVINGVPTEIVAESQLQWLAHEVHGDVAGGHTAAACKATILTDLGISPS